MMLFYCLAAKNEYVIHIDGHNTFVYEFLEGCLLLVALSPLFTLLGVLVEWFGDMQEVLDKMSVEVNEPNK